MNDKVIQALKYVSNNNNKICKLEAYTLFNLLDNIEEYALLRNRLQTLLIPPENILKIVKESKYDKDNYTLFQKVCYLVEKEQNIDCAIWLKTEEEIFFNIQPNIFNNAFTSSVPDFSFNVKKNDVSVFSLIPNSTGYEFKK